MHIEHVAFLMEDPVRAAKWYSDNLGFKIIKEMKDHPYAHFLSDDSGMLLEIYRPSDKPLPDYRSMDPLLLHLAFIVEDPENEKKRLVEAGATTAGETIHTPSGDIIANVKDPWGFTLQLIKRKEPLL